MELSKEPKASSVSGLGQRRRLGIGRRAGLPVSLWEISCSLGEALWDCSSFLKGGGVEGYLCGRVVCSRS